MKILNTNDYLRLKQELMDNGRSTKLYSFINPFSFYEMLDDQNKYSVDGFFVDGIALVLSLKIKYKLVVSRLSFDRGSIADDFLDYCEKKKLKIAFIGASQNEFLIFIEKIQSFWPGLVLDGSRNGFFNDNDLPAIIDSLEFTDVVVLGLGSPLQERIGSILKDNLLNCTIITCGGFITQFSMADNYYPYWINSLNLRWLYRMYKHKHVRQKVFGRYPTFFLRFFFGKSKINF